MECLDTFFQVRYYYRSADGKRCIFDSCVIFPTRDAAEKYQYEAWERICDPGDNLEDTDIRLLTLMTEYETKSHLK